MQIHSADTHITRASARHHLDAIQYAG